MITLSFGYKKPQSPDKGALFFPALEFNIQRLNDHTHNGIDSAPIPMTSVVSSTQTAPAASWIDLTGGNYRQLVTMTAGILFDAVNITTRLAASGHPVMLTIEKVTNTSFYVYINDNTQDVKVIYTT